jgi:hypothetical protein
MLLKYVSSVQNPLDFTEHGGAGGLLRYRAYYLPLGSVLFTAFQIARGTLPF